MKRTTGHVAAAACGLGVEITAFTHPLVILAAAACPLIATYTETHLTQNTNSTKETQ